MRKQRTSVHTRWEELSGPSSVLADIEASYTVKQVFQAQAKCSNALELCAMLVRRVALCLSAPFLVALDGAQIGDLHHNGFSEGAREARRVWIVVSSDREAPSASITCARSGGRAESELVHGCSKTGSRHSTRWASTSGK